MWDPNLSPPEIERLDLLVEECSEVIKAAQKIKRFGYWSTHGGSHPPNIDMLMEELGDLLATITMMERGGEVSREQIEVARQNKLHRMRPYVRFQQEIFETLDKETS
jgi:NTP pyrophosphatase (non-canonical NTP hydrolase)